MHGISANGAQKQGISYEIPVGTDLLTLSNNHFTCVVDYHSKFSIIKQTKEISADNLIITFKIIFAEYGLPSILMLDAGTNFISEKFQDFCWHLDIHHVV